MHKLAVREVNKLSGSTPLLGRVYRTTQETSTSRWRRRQMRACTYTSNRFSSCRSAPPANKAAAARFRLFKNRRRLFPLFLRITTASSVLFFIVVFSLTTVSWVQFSCVRSFLKLTENQQ